MLFSTVIVATGLGLGWRVYGRRPLVDPAAPDPLEELNPAWYDVLRRKFLIDELYEISVIRWNAWCGRAARWLDDTVWEGAVSAASYLVLGLSWASRLMDEYVVDNGFDRGCGGVKFTALIMSLWQNGQVQRYLRVLALSLALGAILFIWGCAR